MVCQSVISALWKKVTKPVRTAFFSGLCIGFVVYLFAMTNTLFLTGDALNNVYFDGNLMWLGRWSSQWLSALSTSYTMPYVNGLLMIGAVAVLAALLVSLFEIRSSLLAAVTAAVMMCFPTVSATLGFLHNADAYMLAAMLAVLGVFMLERLRYGMIPAVLLIAAATGTYQACATLAMSIMFVRGMQLLVFDKASSGKTLLCRAGRYALCLLLSVALYYGVLLLMTDGGKGVGDYQSVTQAASLDTLLKLPENFARCYEDFWRAMGPLSEVEGCEVGAWPNVIWLAVTGLLLPWMLVLFQGKRAKGRLFVLLVMMALAPFFLCGIHIFAPEKVYELMTYSAAGAYLLGIILMDRLPEATERLKERAASGAGRAALGIASWTMLFCLALCAGVWSLSANLKFHKAKLDYENMYAQCATFAALAEQNEDYMQGMPILVIGDSSYNSDRAQPDMHETKLYYTFMKYCLKLNMPFGIANDIRDQANMLAETEDFTLMPCYPEEGCIQMIDDSMVIKLSENDFMN